VRTHYLLDHEYLSDESTLHASMGHLLVFNPGEHDAELSLTLFFEEQEPRTFSAPAPAGVSRESNYTSWPVEPNTCFALRVESSAPVVCQSTVGWNNSGNDYAPSARTHSPNGVRECAKSYMAITQLAQEWYLADGLVIDTPHAYVRESEWAIVLNPGDAPATVTLTFFYEPRQQHTINVPPRRLRRVRMDDIARHNTHYGMRISSDCPVAAQWLRTVKWSDDSELMAYWSVPCVPGPLA
jgi:hypothetical protein